MYVRYHDVIMSQLFGVENFVLNFFEEYHCENYNE